MAGRTISASYAGGITLAVGDSPVTVTATGTVANANAAALVATGAADLVIGNAGTIAAAGTVSASRGITIAGGLGTPGATISNEATGRIAGGQYGLFTFGTTTLSNAGTIVATNIASGVGVVVGAGTVTNSGTAAAITAAGYGIFFGGIGTLNNSGTVSGTGTNSYGVVLNAGGSLDNKATGKVSGLASGVYIGGTVASSAVNVGTISGRHGLRSFVAGSTVTNSGSIQSTGKNTPGADAEFVGAGVQMRNGGTIVNEVGGQISGYWIGAQIGSFNVTTNPNGGAVINAGTILANDPNVSGAALWFKGNGRIENASTGLIGNGPYGIVTYNTVTVANAGVIAGDRSVLFNGGGRIENQAGGTIGGGSRAITLAEQATIANRGHISGTQFAVFTSAEGKGNRIMVYPGASFAGTVLGDKAGVATPTGVLELAAGGSGTIVGFGTSFQSFGRVQVDAGATWSLGGTVASGQTIALAGAGAALTLANPGSVAGVITGFDATTQLMLGGISDVTGSSLGANNVLTLTRSGGGTIALRFDPAQTFLPGSFGFSAGAGGTSLSAPCFALGTRIATPQGEVAVEALAAGMQVRLARGGVSEIVWVGHRRVDCRHHPRPEEVWPVRVAAGAFGRGMPVRDLLLSPDHAVFAGGVLIPVRHLVNGRTVRQEKTDSITYFHVELAAHDVLLAEGLACESYLDTGNRAAFANGGGAMMLHADFARRAWAEGSCAKLVEAGPEVAAARARLLARAGALGHRRGPDPGLTVLAEGRMLPAGGGRWREVALPAGARAVAIASRRWVPAEMEGSEDARPLGVALGRVLLDGAAVPPDDARFGAGWHAPEGDWRWSDGMGWLHLRGARQLRFEVAASGLYWLGDAA